MYQVVKFDKNRDISMTMPNLSTSIRLALENGVVLDTGVESFYNELDDPSSIYGRVQDVFQAMDLQRELLNRASSPNLNDSPSQPVSGETE